MSDETRIALLIDAENISAQYADYIMDEVANYGTCSYKRIYGSWNRIVKTKWESEINKNSLKPVMLLNNTRGKNASDSALIIDAMDILYAGNIDGFCIVSTDSDFTALARRLTEAGKMVIGMGESDKATEALENAYDKFVYIDVLARQAEEERAAELAAETKARKAAREAQDAKSRDSKKPKDGNLPSKKMLEKRIKEIIMDNDDKSRPTDLGEIGQELNKTFRTFDVRYYNRKGGKKYKYLKEFVSDIKGLTLDESSRNRIYVSLEKK